MEVTAGAISPLLRKLGELLMDEYNLEKHVREGVKSLRKELTMMYGALLKVAEVLRGQLDPEVRIWAGMVRELSYDMEDAVDAFLVPVEDEEDRARAGDPTPTNLKNRVKKFLKKTTRLFKKGKDLHQIAGAIEEAQDLAKQLAELRQRYGGLELHDSSAGATIDPRVRAVFKDAKELVGINDTRDELIKMLSVSVQSKQQLNTVSIVGFGGLGKTTLARAVYDKIVEAHFHCGAFVSVGRDPDLKKVFKDLLYKLDKKKYENIHNTTRDEELLIDDLKEVLKNKRYFIVIDDIWDGKLWKYIKCAFPEDNLGSRLITTTRNGSVSEACCPSPDDKIYQMKPLPDDYSRSLFYKRIFPHGNRCPPELKEVSKEILKKCGGVPLAIITIASLLANEQVQTKDKWQIVLDSIGRGLTEGGDVEDMQMILSFSYYDLPSYLKTCLLYLSIFPEDYEIGRDRLIWRWIAEGFVQPKKEGDNLFELGGSYFNELINRSMIQPVYDRYAVSVEACIVHDTVLDLIYSLSREESFVTISDEINTCSQSNVRWLSLQNIKVEHTAPHQATRSMSKVRSITLFSPINLMPTLSCFKVLRVLDLEGCYLGQSCHLNFSHLGNLFHLRYLGLRNTRLCELPREIEKLQFLLTLDLRGANIKQLPSTVVRMKQLMCLLVDGGAMVLPDGMGNLTSLKVLGTISIGKSPKFVEALRSLTRLRELKIQFDETDESSEKALMDSLSTLQEIQTLVICAEESSLDVMGAAGWVPPPHLRRLEAYSRLSRLPAWVESLSHLSSLWFRIEKLPQDDLQILARLPALRFLYIIVATNIRLLVGAGFPSLRSFILFNSGQIMFQEGAMQRVERVQFSIGVRETKDDGSGDFELGLGNLLSLEEAYITLSCTKATVDEAKDAEVALRHAADIHPNHPTLRMDRYAR